MASVIYDKTDKGHEEIATRAHHLPSRLRSLLVLVDGKSNAEILLKKVAGLGLGEDSLSELLDNGFIAALPDQPAKIPSPPQVAAAAPAPVPVAPEAPPEVVSAPSPDPAASSDTAAPATDAGAQYLALYNFYTTTIKSTLGLRGFGMQLKVEKCANIDDFRALRQAYVDAVQKSKGDEMARSLGDRLDHLLGPK